MQEQIVESAPWAFVLMGAVFLYHAARSQKQADKPPPYRTDEPSTEEMHDEMLARWTLAAILDLKTGVYWVGAMMSFGFAAILWRLGQGAT